MFSALSQGSYVYILDKTSSPKFNVGEVIGVSSPSISYNYNQPQSTVNLKVKVDDDVRNLTIFLVLIVI